MKRAILFGLVLFVIVYVLPLGVAPLQSPDETRYSEVPREMIASGDWIVPRLNGVRYFEKPPLGYWLTALSIMVFGENNFAVRLPSTISVGLTAAILAALMHRLLKRPLVSLLTAIVYLTSLMAFAVGSIAILDSLLTLFLTGTLAALLCAFGESRPRARNVLLLLAGLSCGLGFLTKGFLAVAIPAIVVASWTVVENRWKDAFRAIWLPLLAALAVVLPWSLMIHLREPDFWRYFFVVEHLKRFLDPVGASQHPQPAAFFVPVLAAGMAPWLPLVPAAVAGWCGGRVRASWGRFVGAWLLLPFIFFSVSSGKLATYILPCFPPIAMLIGFGLANYLDRRKGNRLFLAGSAISALGAFAGVAAVGMFGGSVYSDGEWWKWALTEIGLSSWGLMSLASGLYRNDRGRIWIYCSAPLLCMFLLHLVYPRFLETNHAFGRLLNAVGARVEAAGIVVADSRTVHAACWHLKRRDLFVLAPSGELAYGLQHAEDSFREVNATDVTALLAGSRREEDLTIILKETNYRGWLESSLSEVPHSLAYQARGNGLVFLQFRPAPQTSVPVVDERITVERLLGRARVRVHDGALVERWHDVQAGAFVGSQSEFETTELARLTLRLVAGHSVRLDRSSWIRVLDRKALALRRGTVYIDSGGAGDGLKTLAVHTRLGVIEGIGARFEVSVDERSLRVRSRESEVTLRRGGELHLVPVGTELQLRNNGVLAERPFSSYDSAWDWAAEIAPVPDVEGLSARDFVGWIARERGWRPHFASEALEQDTGEIRLHGSIERLTLDEALEAMAAVSGLKYRVESGRLMVERM